MKFDKKPNKVYEVYGESYDVRLPLLKDKREYARKVDAVDDLDKIEVMIDFVADLGLPRSVTESLTEDDFELLINDLFGIKKK